MMERPTQGEQVAGIAGLALILTMFLFAWFGIDVPDVAGAPEINGFDAFDAFSDWFNLILVFAAFAGISLALFGSGAERLPVSMSVVTTVLGGIGVIVLIIYLISPPEPGAFEIEGFDIGRKIGAFLGLVELIALTVGGYLTMQEEGVSFSGAADRLSDSSGHQAQHQQHQPPPAPTQGYQPPAQPAQQPPQQPQQAPPPQQQPPAPPQEYPPPPSQPPPGA
jgi:hypothetical protein